MKFITKALLPMLATVALTANAAKPQLDVQLSVNNDSTNGGNVYATLKITNKGNGPQKLLKWYTQLDEEHIFHVTRDGQNVAYEGPHFKRQAPVDGDYIKLTRGQTFEKTYELSALYNMSDLGNYSVTYEVSSGQLFSNKGQAKKAERTALKSNTVNVWSDGLAKNGSVNKGKPGGGNGGSDCIGTTCFTGRCDNSQKNQLLSALSAADSITNNSVAYLNSHSANNTSARYNTWFGAANSSRYNTAKSHFNAINDAIDNQAITFDCSCKKSYFAYVYPNQPYKIFMCRAFWNANELGTDSRAGTIVHELSHFTIVAGTDDVVYGQSGAQNLANTNPDGALNNADSHEYFAENTPYQN